jgi:hypothetical protein
VALGPQANYADRVTATCWRNLVPTFVDRGVSRGQRGGSPTDVILTWSTTNGTRIITEEMNDFSANKSHFDERKSLLRSF